jgi:hypothetical protein
MIGGEAEAEEEPAEGDPKYSFRPALMGSPWEFRLARDGLVWQRGRFQGRTGYDQIRRIRLAYRPATIQNHRFVTEIWPRSGFRLLIASTSWRSIMEQARQDAAYSDFIGELNRRIGAAGGNTKFIAGSPPVLFWAGVVVFVASALGLAALTVRALQAEERAAAALVGGFLALFLWQLGQFLRRNRPRRYRPDSIPRDLLPNA